MRYILIGHIGVTPSCVTSVLKRVLVENLSYDNEFDLHKNKSVGRAQARFYMNGIAGRLKLTFKESSGCPK